MFSTFFTKGDNICDFLFASLGNKAPPNKGQLVKEIICSYRSKLFPSRVDPHCKKGAKIKWSELLPLKVYPFAFNSVNCKKLGSFFPRVNSIRNVCKAICNIQLTRFIKLLIAPAKLLSCFDMHRKALLFKNMYSL